VPEFVLNFQSPLPAHRVVEKAWQKALFEGWKIIEHRHGVRVVMREPVSPLAQGMVVTVESEPDIDCSRVHLKMHVDVGNARSMDYLQRKAEQMKAGLMH
jgi:hypothetical protein